MPCLEHGEGGFVQGDFFGDFADDFGVFFVGPSEGFDDESLVVIGGGGLFLAAVGMLGAVLGDQLQVFVGDLLDGAAQLAFLFVFFLPSILILDVQHFALLVGAVHGSALHVQRIQVAHDDIGDAVGESDLSDRLQIRQLQFERVHELGDVHRIFAGFVQEDVKVEGLVLLAVDVLVKVRGHRISGGVVAHGGDVLHLTTHVHDHLLQFTILLHQVLQQIVCLQHCGMRCHVVLKSRCRSRRIRSATMLAMAIHA